MDRYSQSEVHFKVRNFVKIYPTKIKYFEYKDGFYKMYSGFEPSTDLTESSTSSSRQNSDLDNALRSLRRSKTTISDIVECTQFDLFCTFTFKKDRQNIEKSKQKMKDWLKSQRRRYGNFQYIIVPEFHKDGKSLHFHALLKNYKGKLAHSGKKINNRDAYNISSYQKGFSTAIKIDNHQKVASYVKKYITKDMPMFENKKRYWCSTGLKRPTIQYNINKQNLVINEVYKTEYFTISEAKLAREGKPIFFSPCFSRSVRVKIKTAN